jgi:hypothetical protein
MIYSDDPICSWGDFRQSAPHSFVACIATPNRKE